MDRFDIGQFGDSRLQKGGSGWRAGWRRLADTGCDLTEAAWQKARERFRARTRMFTHLATITTDLVFPSWSALMRTLTTGAPPPQPP